jgi:hypothetical protein
MRAKNNSHLTNLKIDRRIRPRKTINCVLAALLIGSTQLSVGCMKDENSTHYLKTGGSCNQQTTIKIFDETGGIDPTAMKISDSDGSGNYTYQSKPVNTIEHEHFKNYVTSVSKYVFAKVDAMNLCQGTADRPQVELVFVYRPTISGGITPLDFQPDRSGTNQLNSPWAKLALNKNNSSDLKMQAVFIWNERQFVFDELVKCGWHDADNQPLLPIDRPLLPIDLKTFDRWQRDQHRWKTSDYFKHLPIDILLLFISNRSTPILPSGPDRQLPIKNMKSKARLDRIGYTDLNKALIDRLFDSTQAEIRYDGILDLKDVLKIDRYRMNPYIGECNEDSKSATEFIKETLNRQLNLLKIRKAGSNKS